MSRHHSSLLINLLILVVLLALNAFFIVQLYVPELVVTKPTNTGTTTTPSLQARATTTSETGWYRDPLQHFNFLYPPLWGETTYGAPIPGAASVIHFASFSGDETASTSPNGELVVMKQDNRFTQASLGGFYDPQARTLLASSTQAAVTSLLPTITASNFCQHLATSTSISAATASSSPVLGKLSRVQLHSLLDLNLFRNVQSEVLNCARIGDTVIFHKLAKDHATSPQLHVYGAVRFVAKPYATIQLIRRDLKEPSTELMNEMMEVVTSWKAK